MKERQVGQNILAWFKGKTIEELKAITHGKHILVPDAFTFYHGDGTPREDPILIRVPRPIDRTKATITAVMHVQKQMPKGSDFKVQHKEHAEMVVGKERFDQIDSMCLVSLCTHDPDVSQALDEKRVPPPFLEFDQLLTDYLETTIMDVYRHMDFLADLFDPRFTDITEEVFWLFAESVATKENLSPFVVMPPSMQLVCHLKAYKELWHYRKQSLLSSYTGTSTQGS